MRTDDIPNTVCEEDEGCCGDSFSVAAHVARGHLEGEDEGGDEGTSLLGLLARKAFKDNGEVMYNVVAE